MKPFNLEKAKAGEPVYTKDGRPVEIIHWDFNGCGYKIVAIAHGTDVDELNTYTVNGKVYMDGSESGKDLMMGPVHHEGWIAINMYTMHVCSSKIFESEEDLKRGLSTMCLTKPGIQIIKVEWED